MAYSAYKRNNDFISDNEGAYLEFVCDTVGDIDNLPTGPEKAHPYIAQYKKYPRPGSMAVVADTADVYVLSPARVWKKLIEGEV